MPKERCRFLSDPSCCAMGAAFKASHPKEDVDIKNVKPIWRAKPDEVLKAVQASGFCHHRFWIRHGKLESIKGRSLKHHGLAKNIRETCEDHILNALMGSGSDVELLFDQESRLKLCCVARSTEIWGSGITFFNQTGLRIPEVCSKIGDSQTLQLVV